MPIGTSADYVVLMGYDEHWSGSPKVGSVSSLPWVSHGLDTLLKSVPAKKVILAFPLYNRDWIVKGVDTAISSEDLSLGEQVQRVELMNADPKWNAKLGQYTTSYVKSGQVHRIWIEDSRSLSQKYQMAMNHGIAGFAYWHIGGDTPDIWTSLRNTEKYFGYEFK